MKLLTTRGNPLSVKAVAAARIAEIRLDVDAVEDVSGAPMAWVEGMKLDLPNGSTSLFGGNAIVQYLLNPEGSDADSTWCQWEEAQFRPLAFYWVSNPSEAKAQKLASTKLDELETALAAVDYLERDSLSAADIIVWAIVHALKTASAAHAQAVESRPHVEAWYQRVAQAGASEAAAAVGVDETSVKNAAQAYAGFIHLGHVESSRRAAANAVKSNRRPSHAPTETKKAAGDKANEVETMARADASEITAAKASWAHEKACVAPEIKHPVLPQDGKRNVMITSALPYVNNVPHLGNIIGCVLSADIFARYCRMRGYNTLFVCGTDEYGTATETKALEEGMTCQEICDKYNKLHTEIYEWFNIGFDYFGRTTTEKHTTIAQEIFLKCHHNDYFISEDSQQLKCVNCDRFLADRYIEGTCPLCGYGDARGDQCDSCQKLLNATDLINPRCKTCRQAPVERTSTHLYLNLPVLEDKLKEWYNETQAVSPWTRSARGIMKAWFEEGIQPRCVTRDLKWGTPVPLEEYKEKVLYVWFDAPIGYISITANYTDEWRQWWYNRNVELYQFMAKDNVTFHGIIFPGSLMATKEDWTLVKMIAAIEYLNYEDDKFSKSRGVGVFGSDTMSTGIPADVWRFYLALVRPENQDSAFSWSDLMSTNNAILLNNIGNFVHRALTFATSTFGGVVPAMNLQEDDYNLIALVNREIQQYVASLEECKERDGLRNVESISRLGNQYIQLMQPWKLAKDPAQRERCATVVALAINLVYILATVMEPYIPATAQRICEMLDIKKGYLPTPEFLPGVPAGHKIKGAQTLFAKIEQAQIDDFKQRFAGKQSERGKPKEEAKPAAPADPAEVARLEGEIATQGQVVRELKADSSVDAAKVKAEVDKLLALKKQLGALTGGPASGKGKKGKK